MATNSGQGTPLGNLVVNLTLEGSQFSNSLEGIRSDLKMAQSAMRANLAVLGEAGNEYNKLSQHVKDLNQILQINQRQIDELRRKHQQAIDTYGEGSEEARRYGQQINRVVTQQANLQRQLQRTEQQLRDLNNQDTKKLQRQFRELEIHLGRLREHAEEVSQALATMAAPTAVFTGYATSVSTEMEKVQGLLGAGLGLTPAQQKAAGEAAGRIYVEGFGESLTEVGNAYKMVIQFMNLSGEEAEKATKYALGYAETTGDDVQEALRGADALMKHYGMTAEEAFNYLTRGAQKGLNKSNELADNTAEYAQLFKEGGYSAKEMFQILEGGLSAGAYNLDKVNDFVKEFGIRLIDGNFEEKMGFLSKETQNMFWQFKKGKATTADVFKSFQKDLQNMGDNSNATKAKLADMFGGLGEDNALQVIEGLSKVTDSFDDVGNSAEDMNKSLRDTNISNITEGWRSIQSSLRPIGDDILEFAGSIVPKLAKGAEKISGWFEGLGKKGKIFSLALAGIGAVAPIVGAALVMIVGALAACASAISGIMASGILTGLVAALTSFAGIAALVVAGAVAIGLVFRDLWKNSEKFREIVSRLLDALKEFGTFIKDIIIEYVKTMVGIFQKYMLPVLKDFYKFIKDSIIIVLGRLLKFWDDNGGAIMGFINILKEVVLFLTKILAPVFGVIFKLIFSIVKGYISNIINIAMSIIDIFSGIIKFFTGIFTGDLGKAWEGIKEIFRGAVILILNLLSMFFIGKILGVLKGFASSAGNLIKTLWSKISGFFSSGLNKVKDLTTTAKNKIIDIFGMLGSAVIRKFDDMISNAKQVPQKIMDGFSSMKTKLVDKMSEIGNAMKNGLIGGLNGMIGGVNWVLEKLSLSKYKLPLIDTSTPTKSAQSSAPTRGTGNVKTYHKGTPGHPGGPALVNDGKGLDYRELIIFPDGTSVVPTSRNVFMPNMPKGTQVLSGKETKELMKLKGIKKYAFGTGLWNGVKKAGSAVKTGATFVKDAAVSGANAVMDFGEDVWDALTDPVAFFKKMIAKLGTGFLGGLSEIPKKVVKGAYDMGIDKATTWFKNLMFSDEAQSKGHGGAEQVTSGKLAGQWRVTSELVSLASSILPKFKSAVITSGLRPGAKTSAGTLSDHGTGKALDISGYGRNGSPMYTQIAEQFFKSPYVKYVIANNMWKKKNAFNWKPFPWGGHMNHVHVSAFANGGIVDKATFGVFGEAGKEALIPLSAGRKSRGVQLLNEAASHLGQKVTPIGQDGSNEVIQLLMKQNQILMALLNKDQTIEMDGQKVGKIVAPTVKEENEKIDKRNRRANGLQI